MIDSLTGFTRTLRAGGEMLPQFNALLNALKQLNVATVMTLDERHHLQDRDGVDFSYISDNVVRLSYFKRRTEIGRSIWVSKKRYGPHERKVRALEIGEDGVSIHEIDGEFAVTRDSRDEGP